MLVRQVKTAQNFNKYRYHIIFKRSDTLLQAEEGETEDRYE